MTRESAGYWGFIKDPIYGYVRVTETERRIIDTLPVQRLRRIRQLSGAEYVYPAANHSRFEHVVGAMYLAGVLVENLPVEMKPEDRQMLRLAALLHDVGHAPFSHLFEPLMMKYLNRTHEDMSTWIIRETEVGDALRDEGFDPEIMSRLAIGLLEKPPQPFYNQVIRSSVDVDKLDFVVRDSYHTGAGYGFVDVFRLIYTMDVLDGNLAVDATALPTLESLILARLESFRAVYFHRVSRAAQMMILRALEFAKDDLGIPQLKRIEDYLALDDYVVWGKLLEHKQARKIIQDVASRRLLKTAYEKTFFVRDEMVANVFNKESFRDKIAEEIATKAKVDKDEVVLDVPSLPSVPYHYAMQIAPMDIPIFSKTRSGQKVPQKIGELSDLVNLLTNYMNIVRVYTRAEFRDRVAVAAVDVLGESPLSNIVSY